VENKPPTVIKVVLKIDNLASQKIKHLVLVCNHSSQKNKINQIASQKTANYLQVLS
jgi:hypothetical protein